MHKNVGKDKQVYNTKETTYKAAEALERKFGTPFSVYKRAYCTGYHIGRDQK